jgi:hypothetical protein
MLSRFRGYVNNIEVPIINQIRIPNIENIPSTEAEIANEYHVSESNEDSVISFLEMNHAQISKEDLENITTENSKTNRENKENYLLYYRNKLLLNTIDDYIKKIIDKKKSIIPSTMVISREPIPSSSPSNTKTRKRKSRESPKPSIKKNHQITKKRKITGGYNKRPKKQLFISSRILHK